MSRSKSGSGEVRAPDDLPKEIGTLLEEIEKEAVPERLLVLAAKLQSALAEQRRKRGRSEIPASKDA